MFEAFSTGPILSAPTRSTSPNRPREVRNQSVSGTRHCRKPWHIALMEDLDFVRRLEKDGRTCCISDPFLTTSSRRFEGEARWRSSTGWLKLHAVYHLGVRSERLARHTRPARLPQNPKDHRPGRRSTGPRPARAGSRPAAAIRARAGSALRTYRQRCFSGLTCQVFTGRPKASAPQGSGRRRVSRDCNSVTSPIDVGCRAGTCQ